MKEKNVKRYKSFGCQAIYKGPYGKNTYLIYLEIER